MNVLLEIRDNIKEAYIKYDAFINPIGKFFLALITLLTINSRLGYMHRIDSTAIVLVVALGCSFMPAGVIMLFGALFSILHAYSLSLEAVVIVGVVYLVLYLLYLRFVPKESVVIVASALLCAFKMPYLLPVPAGLLGTPATALSVGAGVIVYSLLKLIAKDSEFVTGAADAEIADKIRMLIDGLLRNKAMLLFIIAFAITIIVVYVIRRLPIVHAWTISVAAGTVIEFIVLVAGNAAFKTGLKMGVVFFQLILSLGVALVVEFFKFLVDYDRAESVQFEDDDYYYYVKAVPKIKRDDSFAGETGSPKKAKASVRKVNPKKTRSAVLASKGKKKGKSAAEEYYDDGADEYYEDEYYEDGQYEEEYYGDDETAGTPDDKYRKLF